MSAQCSRVVPALFIVALSVSATAVAQGSTGPADIPVFPNAERYEPDERQVVTTIRETLLGLSDGLPLAASMREHWYATVTPDKVDAFYRARLRGIASGFAQWKAVDPRALAPGRATSVHVQRYTDGGTTRYVYHWYRREANGDIVLLELAFGLSIALDPRLPQSGPLTVISAIRKTFSMAAAVSAPDERALGVPVYPGARYDANASTNTLGALFRHVFLSVDAPALVVAFYEDACGSKALQGAPLAGGVNWVFRPCRSAFPDDYIVIEAADADGSPRTRITFHLMRDAPPDRD